MSDDEKAKLGYQMAIQMIMYEGQLIWKALALMVIINSLIFGIVVVLAQTYPGVSGRKFIPWLRFASPFWSPANCSSIRCPIEASAHLSSLLAGVPQHRGSSQVAAASSVRPAFSVIAEPEEQSSHAVTANDALLLGVVTVSALRAC